LFLSTLSNVLVSFYQHAAAAISSAPGVGALQHTVEQLREPGGDNNNMRDTVHAIKHWQRKKPILYQYICSASMSM